MARIDETVRAEAHPSPRSRRRERPCPFYVASSEPLSLPGRRSQRVVRIGYQRLVTLQKLYKIVDVGFTVDSEKFRNIIKSETK